MKTTGKYKYSIRPGELVLSEKDTGKIIWKGKVKQLEVTEIIKIEDNDECIAVLNRTQALSARTSNSVCIKSDGSIKWDLEKPKRKFFIFSYNDCGIYHNVQRVKNFLIHKNSKDYRDVLIARSESGYQDIIDINTGKIIDSLKGDAI